MSTLTRPYKYLKFNNGFSHPLFPFLDLPLTKNIIYRFKYNMVGKIKTHTLSGRNIEFLKILYTF